MAFLFILAACSDEAAPPPEPGPCSIVLGSQDGQPPNVDASAERWSMVSPRLDARRLIADQTSLALSGSGGRQPGSPSHTSAVQYLMGRLAEIGLDPVGAGYAHEFATAGATRSERLGALFTASQPETPIADPVFFAAAAEAMLTVLLRADQDVDG